jgi:hypothetical protein
MGEWRYSSTHSFTSVLDEVSGQLHAPAALILGKEPPVTTGYEADTTQKLHSRFRWKFVLGIYINSYAGRLTVVGRPRRYSVRGSSRENRQEISVTNSKHDDKMGK